MVCHICGKPASAYCSECSRYICSNHTNPGNVCTSCQELTDNRLKDVEAKIARTSIERKCAFCGALDVCKYGAFIFVSTCSDCSEQEYWRHRRCSQCGKFFCPSHSKSDSVRVSYGQDVWIRCQNHPRKKGGLFSKGDPPDKHVSEV